MICDGNSLREAKLQSEILEKNSEYLGRETRMDYNRLGISFVLEKRNSLLVKAMSEEIAITRKGGRGSCD